MGGKIFADFKNSVFISSDIYSAEQPVFNDNNLFIIFISSLAISSPLDLGAYFPGIPNTCLTIIPYCEAAFLSTPPGFEAISNIIASGFIFFIISSFN